MFKIGDVVLCRDRWVHLIGTISILGERRGDPSYVRDATVLFDIDDDLNYDYEDYPFYEESGRGECEIEFALVQMRIFNV